METQIQTITKKKFNKKLVIPLAIILVIGMVVAAVAYTLTLNVSGNVKEPFTFKINSVDAPTTGSTISVTSSDYAGETSNPSTLTVINNADVTEYAQVILTTTTDQTIPQGLSVVVNGIGYPLNSGSNTVTIPTMAISAGGSQDFVTSIKSAMDMTPTSYAFSVGVTVNRVVGP